MMTKNEKEISIYKRINELLSKIYGSHPDGLFDYVRKYLKDEDEYFEDEYLEGRIFAYVRVVVYIHKQLIAFTSPKLSESNLKNEVVERMINSRRCLHRRRLLNRRQKEVDKALHRAYKETLELYAMILLDLIYQYSKSDIEKKRQNEADKLNMQIVDLKISWKYDDEHFFKFEGYNKELYNIWRWLIGNIE